MGIVKLWEGIRLNSSSVQRDSQQPYKVARFLPELP